MLHFIKGNLTPSGGRHISIHTMLRFIHRKYKIPLLRDIHILPHKSTFFNTFYIFSLQHFILENHHIYQSISYIAHSLPVSKNKNNHKHYHIVTVITVTLFIIMILTTGCHIRSTLYQQYYLFCFLRLRRFVTIIPTAPQLPAANTMPNPTNPYFHVPVAPVSGKPNVGVLVIS